MKQPLSIAVFCRYRNILFQETKRFAGHSKWQNIKHIKEEKDSERADLFRSLTAKMKSAVTEGGSMKPSENVKLAQLLDQAKKANMPTATLNSFFEKLSEKNKKTPNTLMEVRGPGGCIMILHIATHKIVMTKMQINTLIKKFNAKILESPVKMLFDYASYITASKNCSLDKAVDDAIQVNAEEVEEVQEGDLTCFRFKCELVSTAKVAGQLKNLEYNIISMVDECIPKTLVNLNEEDLKKAELLKKKLLVNPEIEKINDNIA